MQHFVSFSNSARKSFTRQKQAKLLGQNAPSTSYVDRIQTARRGATSEINSPYYISRNEAMTHPQDNRKVVSTQKIFQQVVGSESPEIGISGYRQNKKLKLGGFVVGNNEGVKIEDSVLKNPVGAKRIFDMHSHPNRETNPSQVDMYRDYQKRTQNNGKYESLIFTPSAFKGRKDAPFTITEYRQEAPTEYIPTTIKLAGNKNAVINKHKGLGGERFWWEV